MGRERGVGLRAWPRLIAGAVLGAVPGKPDRADAATGIAANAAFSADCERGNPVRVREEAVRRGS